MTIENIRKIHVRNTKTEELLWLMRERIRELLIVLTPEERQLYKKRSRARKGRWARSRSSK